MIQDLEVNQNLSVEFNLYKILTWKIKTDIQKEKKIKETKYRGLNKNFSESSKTNNKMTFVKSEIAVYDD